eukprot:s3983_g5.t1
MLKKPVDEELASSQRGPKGGCHIVAWLGGSDGSRSERDRARAYGEEQADEAEPEPIESDSALEDMMLDFIPLKSPPVMKPKEKKMPKKDEGNQQLQLKKWEPWGQQGQKGQQWDPAWDRWDWGQWQDRQLALWEEARYEERRGAGDSSHQTVHYEDGTVAVDGKLLQTWQLESYRENSSTRAAQNEDLSREERGQILSLVNAMAATLKEVVSRKK